MELRLRKTVRLTPRGGCVLLALAFVLLALSGCRSPYVQADIRNASGQPISLVEVDYPSASFGKDILAAGADYTYRFKILGSGPTTVLWTDVHHKQHTIAGPNLQEGQQGTLLITITSSGATWLPNLQP